MSKTRSKVIDQISLSTGTGWVKVDVRMESDDLTNEKTFRVRYDPCDVNVSGRDCTQVIADAKEAVRKWFEIKWVPHILVTTHIEYKDVPDGTMEEVKDDNPDVEDMITFSSKLELTYEFLLLGEARGIKVWATAPRCSINLETGVWDGSAPNAGQGRIRADELELGVTKWGSTQKTLLPLTKANIDALSLFCRRLNELRRKMADYLSPAKAEKFLAQLSGTRLLEVLDEAPAPNVPYDVKLAAGIVETLKTPMYRNEAWVTMGSPLGADDTRGEWDNAFNHMARLNKITKTGSRWIATPPGKETL